MSVEKPWKGRFSAPTNAFVEAFTASVPFDHVLYRYDIQGSLAHARMLEKIGVLTPQENQAIASGLEEILQQIESGEFSWSVALEDVHMNIESELTRRIGEAGKKLHTGRSRNDQVATDTRLYLREEINQIRALLQQLAANLLALAEQEADTVMPGFTHLQSAQPVTFGHHLLAWTEMLLRDHERLADCHKRVNVMPLGSAALAGTTYPIDRAYTAELLGFAYIAENSLDAVSDRDFAIEFTACAAILMMHLSRMAEELILWSSSRFQFIELSDAFCTGSSIMPQKKNPDVPELVRGKTGRVYGHLFALLTLMKAQPLAYNKDNQEDKEPIFDTVDQVKGCLRVYADMIPAIHVRRESLRAAALEGFTTATDLADYLVKQGMPFRAAHEVVGQAVQYCIRTHCALHELPLAKLREFSPRIGEEVYAALTLEGSLAARDHFGGTAPAQVRQAIVRARQRWEQ